MTQLDEFIKACEFLNPPITEERARFYFYTCNKNAIELVISEYRKESTK